MKKSVLSLMMLLSLLVTLFPDAYAEEELSASADPVTVSLTAENFFTFYEEVRSYVRTEKNGSGVDIYPEFRLSYRLKPEFAKIVVAENSSVTIKVNGTYVLTVIDQVDWKTGEITLTDHSSSEPIITIRSLMLINGSKESAAKYGITLSETAEGALEIPIPLNYAADGAWLFASGIRGPVAPLLKSDYVAGKTMIEDLQGLRVVSATGELQLTHLPEGVDPSRIEGASIRNENKDDSDPVTDMEYLLYEDGTAEITRYTGDEKHLTVPDRIKRHEVRTIGSYAFSYCDGLESVILPDSIVRMEDGAFSNCSSLTEVHLPAKMEVIGSGAFSGCSSLPEITLPAGLTQIGWSTFYNCSSLRSITIPAGVTQIGRSCFYNCSSLQNITLPAGVIKLGESAFTYCSSLWEITLPTSVTEIGNSAFANCSNLEKITIPNNVTVIGNYAFSNCEMLQEIIVPAGVTEIGRSTFYNCSGLKNITLPAGVRTIGDWAFWGCVSLQSITLSEGLQEIGESAFSWCRSLTAVTLPGSLTMIAAEAFSGCEALDSILLPENLKGLGEKTFSDCTSLKEIRIPDRIRTIADKTFYRCESLERVEFPTRLKEIGEYAFYDCSALKALELPDGLTGIGDSAFLLCSSLGRVVFPDGLVSIGKRAFDCCWELGVVELPDSIREMGIDALPDGLGTIAIVGRDSYPATYCEENGIRYRFYDEAPPWQLLPENEKPGSADLEAIGSDIEYPLENEYLANYAYATVTASKGHSVFGFGSADHQGRSFTVLNGEEVRILAERKGYVCCIVLSQGVARWINRDHLAVFEPVMDNGTVRMTRDDQMLSITMYGITVSDEYAVEGISEKKDYMEPEYQWKVSFSDREHRYMVDISWHKEYPPVNRTVAFEDMATRFYVEKDPSRYYHVLDPEVSHTDSSITWKISLEDSGIDCESIKDVSAYTYSPEGGHYYG